MKIKLFILFSLLMSVVHGAPGVGLDEEALGKSLGGWKKKNSYAEYSLSGANYRTYKPEISPSPDGGIFVSIRIDHVRGWLSSDDHAILEVSISPRGAISSAQSNIAIQGRSIKSDVITGSSEAGKSILNPDRAVQVGTDLVADLSAKLLRENIVEAGRVTFPAAIRHNYNRLFQSIRVEVEEIKVAVPVPNEPVKPPPAAPTPPPAPSSAPASVPAPNAPAPAKDEKKEAAPGEKKPEHSPLEFKPYF